MFKHTISISLIFFVIAGTALANTVQTKTVVYSSPLGEELKATLYLPTTSSESNRPAVVLIHGGSWVFGTRHQLHWYGSRLAEHGYVAMAITYRMYPEYKYPACFQDCKSAVRWLRRHAKEYQVDPNRIGALGNSAGGHLTELLATINGQPRQNETDNLGYDSSIKTAISYYGVADLTYYKNPDSFLRHFSTTQTFFNNFLNIKAYPKADPYAAASPVRYINEKSCPTLLIHGTNDHLVPYDQSIVFTQLLVNAGVPTRLITVPYDHAFDFFHPQKRAAVFQEVLTFLDMHLAGK